MYTIYALVDPRDYTVHYVGQTTDVYQRFSQHINGDGKSFVKNAWLFELRALNRMVIMETLEEVSTSLIANEREMYWIKHFEMLREPLTNATHRAVLKKVKRDQMKASRQAAAKVLMAIETQNTVEIPLSVSEMLPCVSTLAKPVERDLGDFQYGEDGALSPKLQRVMDLHNAGYSLLDIGKRMGTSKATAGRQVQKLKQLNYLKDGS